MHVPRFIGFPKVVDVEKSSHSFVYFLPFDECLNTFFIVARDKISTILTDHILRNEEKDSSQLEKKTSQFSLRVLRSGKHKQIRTRLLYYILVYILVYRLRKKVFSGFTISLINMICNSVIHVTYSVLILINLAMKLVVVLI